MSMMLISRPGCGGMIVSDTEITPEDEIILEGETEEEIKAKRTELLRSPLNTDWVTEGCLQALENI